MQTVKIKVDGLDEAKEAVAELQNGLDVLLEKANQLKTILAECKKEEN